MKHFLCHLSKLRHRADLQLQKKMSSDSAATICLRIFGLFPPAVPVANGTICRKIFVKSICITCFLGLFAINLFLFVLFIDYTRRSYRANGLLHAYTITMIVVGLLPLQDAFHVLMFFCKWFRIQRLLKDIVLLDLIIPSKFNRNFIAFTVLVVLTVAARNTSSILLRFGFSEKVTNQKPLSSN